MSNRFLGRFLMTATMLAGTGIALANSGDTDIAKSLTHELRMYTRYTIWDDVNFRVANGQVELNGAVNQPFKKADMGRIAQRVAGVTTVKNNIKVLPLSPFDDGLRLRVARAIYGDPVMQRYAMNPNPSIHIVVENGHVTLTGFVANEMDKNIAGIRAGGAGLAFGPVVNKLQVEAKPAKKS
jgi:hyperosmotically inducible protein